MEILVSNSGKARSVTRNGREYLVVPATIIVPGNLSGSNGDLYYPPSETKRSVGAWNGTKITMTHPMVNGQYVSASHKTVQHYGWLENTEYAGKLRTEAWMDVKRLMTHPDGPDVVNRLRIGEQVELSTGLYTDNIVRNGIDPRSGRAYSLVATNFKPDHLAILPHDKGACSLKDGCGFNVNAGACCDACAKHSGGKNMKCPECKGAMTLNKKSGVYTCNNADCGYKAKPGKMATNAGANCGIGSGGFAKGNKCAAGGGGGGGGMTAKNKAGKSVPFDPAKGLMGSDRAEYSRLKADHAKLDGSKSTDKANRKLLSSRMKTLEKKSAKNQGLTLNTGGSTVTDMKKKLVKWLTTNCSEWSGQEQVLNKMGEVQLKAMRKNAMAANEAEEIKETVKTTLGITDLNANTLTSELKKLTAKPAKTGQNIIANKDKKKQKVTANAATDDDDDDDDDDDAPEPPAKKPKAKPLVNKADDDDNDDPLMDEYKQVVAERRQELANNILDRMDLVDEDARKKKYKSLIKLTTNELKEELALYADKKGKKKLAANRQDDDDDMTGYRPSRVGANAHPTANRGANDEELTPIPVEDINWGELSAFGTNQR